MSGSMNWGQVVRWRAENDRIGHAHETWLTDRALEALRAARRAGSVISEWVFPPPTDPREPVSRHLVRDCGSAARCWRSSRRNAVAAGTVAAGSSPWN